MKNKELYGEIQDFSNIPIGMFFVPLEYYAGKNQLATRYKIDSWHYGYTDNTVISDIRNRYSLRVWCCTRGDIWLLWKTKTD